MEKFLKLYIVLFLILLGNFNTALASPMQEYYMLARQAQEENKPQLAIQYYGMALKFNPHLIEAYSNRGHSKIAIKDFKGAVKDFEEIIKINPDDTQAYFDKANACFLDQNYKETIKNYSIIIKKEPNSYIAYYQRGVAKLKFKKYRSAIRDFKKASKISKYEVNPFLGMGDAYVGLKDYKKAYRAYSNVLKIDTQNAMGYYKRGLMRMKINDPQLAIGDLNQAIFLTNSDPEIVWALGEIQFELKNYNEAFTLFDKSIEKEHTTTDKYILRTDYKIKTGRYQEAIIDLDNMLDADYSFFEVYMKRGLAKYYLGQYKEALEDLNSAVYLNKHSVEAFVYRSWIDSKLNNGNTFRDLFKAFTLNPIESIKINSTKH